MNHSLSVNGVHLGEAHLARAAREAGGDPRAAARVAAVRELLCQEARRCGLLAPEAGEGQEETAIEALLEREVQVPQPGEEECRRVFDANCERFRSGDLVAARHILFAVTPGAPVAAIRAKAEEILGQLLREPAGFADLAGQCSNCPSGAEGGALGQLGRGETVPEFDAALFADESIGVLPRLVSSRYGFHVVAVDRRIAGTPLPFEAVHERIAARLAARVWEKALAQYVQVLAGRADVEGTDLGASASPLVQ